MCTLSLEAKSAIYINLLKPMVESCLKTDEERRLAAKWVEFLLDMIGKNDICRQYLKLLLLILPRKRMLSIFKEMPSCGLHVLPDKVLTVALELICNKDACEKEQNICGDETQETLKQPKICSSPKFVAVAEKGSKKFILPPLPPIKPPPALMFANESKTICNTTEIKLVQRQRSGGNVQHEDPCLCFNAEYLRTTLQNEDLEDSFSRSIESIFSCKSVQCDRFHINPKSIPILQKGCYSEKMYTSANNTNNLKMDIINSVHPLSVLTSQEMVNCITSTASKPTSNHNETRIAETYSHLNCEFVKVHKLSTIPNHGKKRKINKCIPDFSQQVWVHVMTDTNNSIAREEPPLFDSLLSTSNNVDESQLSEIRTQSIIDLMNNSLAPDSFSLREVERSQEDELLHQMVKAVDALDNNNSDSNVLLDGSLIANQSAPSAFFSDLSLNSTKNIKDESAPSMSSIDSSLNRKLVDGHRDKTPKVEEKSSRTPPSAQKRRPPNFGLPSPVKFEPTRPPQLQAKLDSTIKRSTLQRSDGVRRRIDFNKTSQSFDNSSTQDPGVRTKETNTYGTPQLPKAHESALTIFSHHQPSRKKKRLSFSENPPGLYLNESSILSLNDSSFDIPATAPVSNLSRSNINPKYGFNSTDSGGMNSLSMASVDLNYTPSFIKVLPELNTGSPCPCSLTPPPPFNVSSDSQSFPNFSGSSLRHVSPPQNIDDSFSSGSFLPNFNSSEQHNTFSAPQSKFSESFQPPSIFVPPGSNERYESLPYSTSFLNSQRTPKPQSLSTPRSPIWPSSPPICGQTYNLSRPSLINDGFGPTISLATPPSSPQHPHEFSELPESSLRSVSIPQFAQSFSLDVSSPSPPGNFFEIPLQNTTPPYFCITPHLDETNLSRTRATTPSKFSYSDKSITKLQSQGQCSPLQNITPPSFSTTPLTPPPPNLASLNRSLLVTASPPQYAQSFSTNGSIQISRTPPPYLFNSPRPLMQPDTTQQFGQTFDQTLQSTPDRIIGSSVPLDTPSLFLHTTPSSDILACNRSILKSCTPPEFAKSYSIDSTHSSEQNNTSRRRLMNTTPPLFSSSLQSPPVSESVNSPNSLLDSTSPPIFSELISTLESNPSFPCPHTTSPPQNITLPLFSTITEVQPPLNVSSPNRTFLVKLPPPQYNQSFHTSESITSPRTPVPQFASTPRSPMWPPVPPQFGQTYDLSFPPVDTEVNGSPILPPHFSQQTLLSSREYSNPSKSLLQSVSPPKFAQTYSFGQSSPSQSRNASRTLLKNTTPPSFSSTQCSPQITDILNPSNHLLQSETQPLFEELLSTYQTMPSLPSIGIASPLQNLPPPQFSRTLSSHNASPQQRSVFSDPCLRSPKTPPQFICTQRSPLPSSIPLQTYNHSNPSLSRENLKTSVPFGTPCLAPQTPSSIEPFNGMGSVLQTVSPPKFAESYSVATPSPTPSNPLNSLPTKYQAIFQSSPKRKMSSHVQAVTFSPIVNVSPPPFQDSSLDLGSMILHFPNQSQSFVDFVAPPIFADSYNQTASPPHCSSTTQTPPTSNQIQLVCTPHYFSQNAININDISPPVFAPSQSSPSFETQPFIEPQSPHCNSHPFQSSGTYNINNESRPISPPSFSLPSVRSFSQPNLSETQRNQSRRRLVSPPFHNRTSSPNQRGNMSPELVSSNAEVSNNFQKILKILPPAATSTPKRGSEQKSTASTAWQKIRGAVIHEGTTQHHGCSSKNAHMFPDVRIRPTPEKNSLTNDRVSEPIASNEIRYLPGSFAFSPSPTNSNLGSSTLSGGSYQTVGTHSSPKTPRPQFSRNVHSPLLPQTPPRFGHTYDLSIPSFSFGPQQKGSVSEFDSLPNGELADVTQPSYESFGTFYESPAHSFLDGSMSILDSTPDFLRESDIDMFSPEGNICIADESQPSYESIGAYYHVPRLSNATESIRILNSDFLRDSDVDIFSPNSNAGIGSCFSNYSGEFINDISAVNLVDSSLSRSTQCGICQ